MLRAFVQSVEEMNNEQRKNLYDYICNIASCELDDSSTDDEFNLAMALEMLALDLVPIPSK